MRWRPFHFALILFQAFWLNVVIPGHTRGAITLPGAGCEDSTCPFHTSMAGACCDTDGAEHRGQPMPAKRVANCAICAFAARLTPPPAIDLWPPELRLAELLPLPPPHTAPASPFTPTYYAREPPPRLVRAR